MTPALVALSRAYTELPGALTVPAACCSDECANIGHLCADDGTRWVFVPEAGCEDIGAGEWILDLTASAAGGVMLGLLPVAVKVVTRTEPRSFRLMWLAEDGEGLGPRQHTTPWLDTLAEAVARVAVAVGRAG